jgi:hypothetical protein
VGPKLKSNPRFLYIELTHSLFFSHLLFILLAFYLRLD